MPEDIPETATERQSPTMPNSNPPDPLPNPAPKPRPWLWFLGGCGTGCVGAAVLAAALSLGGAGLGVWWAARGLAETEVVHDRPIAPGAPIEACIGDHVAHDWHFSGRKGQVFLIEVDGFEGSDPHVSLLDPEGNEILYDDDSTDLDARLSGVLPMDGDYTARVGAWVPGPYTIELR